MSQLYCVECQNYLMGSDGECHDCSCGWKQPVETYVSENASLENERDELKEEIEALQAENAELKEINDSLHSSSKFTYENQKREIEALRKQVEEMLTAMRRAVLALAFAAESSNAMKDDYQALSNAIEKAVSAQKGTEHGTS